MNIPILPASTYRPKMEEACYALTREKGGKGYSLFLHKIQVHASNHTYGPVASIGVTDAGEFTLYLHWPTCSKLSKDAFRELIKHEVLHPIHGHIGARWEMLCERYGKPVANMAADLVVNQHIDPKPLAAAGLTPILINDFGFEKDLSTTQYAELILKDPKAMEMAKRCYPAKIDIKDLKEILDALQVKGNFEVIISDGMTEEAAPPETASRVVMRILDAVKSELEARGEYEEGRGWGSADQDEFIAQVKRPAQVGWDDKIRRLETKYRAEERVATYSRPSRRHPDHLGRIRKGMVKVFFGVDTSGSMGDTQLNVIEAELVAMVTRGEIEITLVHNDAEVKKMERFQAGDKLLKFFGRGGTDFSPFLLKLWEIPPEDKPNFCVFYTDGYGCISQYVEALTKRWGVKRWQDFIADTPMCSPEGMPILWLLAEGTTSPEGFRQIAPFGDIAVLPASKQEIAVSSP